MDELERARENMTNLHETTPTHNGYLVGKRALEACINDAGGSVWNKSGALYWYRQTAVGHKVYQLQYAELEGERIKWVDAFSAYFKDAKPLIPAGYDSVILEAGKTGNPRADVTRVIVDALVRDE